MQTTIVASRTPDATRFGLKLIEWNYGHLCMKVMENLIKHGRQTLNEMRYLSKISLDALRTALIVLIQQNCIAVYLHTGEHDRREEQLYEADINYMLQIIRMPRFVEYVRTEFGNNEEWGEISVAVVQTLLHHGRLRLAQLPLAVRSMRAAEGQENDPSPLTMLTAVQNLINARIVERVPPCTLPPPAAAVVVKNNKKKPTQPKPGSEEELQQQREMARERVYAEYQQSRFDATTEATVATFTMPPTPAAAAAPLNEDEEDEDEGAALGGKRRGAAGGVSSKRGRGAATTTTTSIKSTVAVKNEDGSLVNPLTANSDAEHETSPAVLWRVNYEELNRQLMYREILKYLNDQHSDKPNMALTVKTLMCIADSKDLERRQRQQREGGLRTDVGEEEGDKIGQASLDELMRESRRLHGEAASGHGVIEQALLDLMNEEFVPDAPPWSLDVSFTLSVVRLNQLFSIIKQRFGETGLRIWHMLFMEKQLEQKAIAEKAMVPNAEAREALYAMMKMGYLGLQDIPKNNDRAPSKTCYTWRASAGTASSRVSTELYASAGNVVARLTKETEEKAGLLEMVDLVSQGQLDAAQLDATEVGRLKAVIRTLEMALLRLDDQIALFNEF